MTPEERQAIRKEALQGRSSTFGVLALDAALTEAEAELDKIRDAAAWVLANRGHRGEQQAWNLLSDALAPMEDASPQKEDTDE